MLPPWLVPVACRLKSDRLASKSKGGNCSSLRCSTNPKNLVVKKKPALQEYPDAGTIEAEMARTGGTVEGRKVPGQAGPLKAVPTKGPMPTPKIANTSKIRKP
jgi:hypothetical protein